MIGLLWFTAGMVLLIAGAEAMVRGAARLASLAGVPPLIVGLTVVGFGTSAPELVVGLDAGLRGRPDLTVGNVVGSTTFNILFILGVSALIAPLTVSRQLVRLDVPILIGVSALLFWFAADGGVSRAEGLLLGAGMIVYTIILIRLAWREDSPERAVEAIAITGTVERRASTIGMELGLVAVGLGTLVVGARLVVDAAVQAARAFGISELVVGLTVVAIGTSLPEVATSVVAAARGERDLAVGNAIGSSIFNTLFVVGMCALLAPAGLPVSSAALGFDIPIMLAATVACLPVFFTGHVISRWEGLVFLVYYAAYFGYLLLDATGHAARDHFGMAVLGFVLPLTALTAAIYYARTHLGAARSVGVD